jgi:hypothetical protein
MTAPPAAAITPSTPDPVPPPVAGALTGRPVLVSVVGEGVSVAVEVSVAVAVAVAVPVAVEVLVPVPVAVAVAVAVHVEEGVGLALGEADVLALGEALAVVQGVGVQLGVGLGEALALGEADVLVLGEALVVVQLVVVAPATPPNGPVNVAKAIEINRATVPAARPTSPTLCSFSQLLCRDRRKIVTILGYSG